MSTQQEKSAMTSTQDEENVVAFLRRHPEFFERHEDLLEDLKLPHQAGRAVSLIERQVGVLREKNQHLKRQLNELISNARDNDKLSVFVHRLTLGLLQTRTAGDVVSMLHLQLCEQFPNERISLVLLSPPIAPEALDNVRPDTLRLLAAIDPGLDHFSAIFDNARAVCGRLKAAQVQLLFGEDSAEIGSCAVIPLRAAHTGGKRLGLLAVGSDDRQRFHSSMGTVFISQMGDLISCALEQRQN